MRWWPSAALYDAVQRLAGEERFQARLAAHGDAVAAASVLVDIGGGTGRSPLRSRVARYICLDVDRGKLLRFRRRSRTGLAVAGDATRCPFPDGRVDAVLCTKVVHHLDDRQLRAAFAEIVRILKPGGVLVLADALRSPRIVPTALWRLDRGSFPRTADEISAALPAGLSVERWDRFRLGAFHDIVIVTARRVAAARPDAESLPGRSGQRQPPGGAARQP